ncbi:hypothetical protein ElyMa_002929300 [Elysia marginata]|uniref:Uncharacterized protein n=1 Tax=Elysia marginata TaxID=1093978 RepID=A0AAV4I5C0_9GAST|nr:hypothetical protein ElyMa_002929300 [Elysia marginata]
MAKKIKMLLRSSSTRSSQRLRGLRIRASLPQKLVASLGLTNELERLRMLTSLEMKSQEIWQQQSTPTVDLINIEKNKRKSQTYDVQHSQMLRSFQFFL